MLDTKTVERISNAIRCGDNFLDGRPNLALTANTMAYLCRNCTPNSGTWELITETFALGVFRGYEAAKRDIKRGNKT